MQITMISPGWSQRSIWGHVLFKFPVLSLPSLASATPPEHHIQYIDDNIEKIPDSLSTDLVAITAMTPLAPRAYEIADKYRLQGIPVVMGGVHPTFCPDESLRHADAIVIGEADEIWSEVLSDFERGALQPRYKSSSLVNSTSIRPSRRSILSGKKYFFTNFIQTTRGCPFDCEFCSVTSFYGGTYRTRPLASVETELGTLGKKGSFLFIVDDNILGVRSYTRDLFSLLHPFQFKWLSHASINLAFTGELLRAAADSGCIGLFVGFESLNQGNLDLMGKKVNKIETYSEAIQRFHDAGIGILGSFVIGYDHDDERTFDRIYEFAVKSRLDAALFTILTPFPGTRVRERLQEQGRLLGNNWNDYDMEHVVFKPAGMSPDVLYQKWQELTLSFHSTSSMLKRLFRPHRSLQFFIPSNIGFRIGWKRCFSRNRRNTEHGDL